MEINFTEEKLIDKTKIGKVRPWREKKKDNLIYAKYLNELHFKKAQNVKQCGEFLTFKKMPDGHLKLHQTWFCKSKLCPMCNWRRSLKSSSQLKELLEVTLQKNPTGRFLFLTLTQENSSGENLKKDLSSMSKALHRLLGYKKISRNLLGYVRSLEITVNDKDKDNITYHPHFHIILFMKKEYFENSKNYLDQSEWTEKWQKALKVDYTPIVNIKAVKARSKRKGKNSLISAAQETAKYQVKSKDIITGDEERDLQVIDTLELALSGSRQISYGGLFKKLRRELQLDDTEDGDLINVSEDEKDEEEEYSSKNYIIAKWNYRKQDYYVLQATGGEFTIYRYPKRKKKRKIDVLLA